MPALREAHLHTARAKHQSHTALPHAPPVSLHEAQCPPAQVDDDHGFGFSMNGSRSLEAHAGAAGRKDRPRDDHGGHGGA